MVLQLRWTDGLLRGLLCIALGTFLLPSAADLTHELYHEAKRSSHMRSLTLEDIDEFTGPGRPAPNVMVLFHEASCHICRDALPKLAEAARQLRKRGVAVEVGHVDCSSATAAAKKLFALKGFPSLLFWRAPATEADPARLVGSRLHAGGDAAALLRASRAAGMAEARDGARRGALGRAGEVLEVDQQDMTARLDVPDVGRVWLPLEVLRDEAGRALGHRRADAAFHCDATRFGGWRREAMQSFAERMSRPTVTRLETLQQLASELRGEDYPALVFCGERPPPAFAEAAAAAQDASRAFHAEWPSACPVPGAPQVVVYSPPEQQWPQGVGSSAWVHDKGTAAVVASGSDVLDDADALTQWIQSHRFVGITLLSYSNFFWFLRSHERVLVVAVDLQDGELNPRVEKRLLALASPEVREDRGIYEFADNSTEYAIAVVDGSLSGLETYGVMLDHLPHMIVMEGPDQWVEDAAELSVWGLPSNLKKVSGMWRMTHGLGGYLRWWCKQLGKSFSFYHNAAQSIAGTWGVLTLYCVLASVPLMSLVIAYRLARSLAASLLGDDPEDEARKED